ncbi:MAG: hypothetical protein H7A37_10060 [Chlamydiales bacterium]|nr:hypothetical protein [Chlamydiia bacterium]MCP5508620.1 hypothetical protein [Chlamydiales bacterium]
MIKSLNLFLALAFVPLIFIGCSNGTPSTPSTRQVVEALGLDAVETIKNSQDVTFSKAAPDSNNNFKIVGEPRALSHLDYAALKQILLDDRSYIFDKTKACLFIPEAVITFNASAPVKVLISPSCKQLKFLYEGESVILDCDPIMENLKTMFPEII